MIDKYFSRTYDAANYNCAHLVCEFWRDNFGPELGEILSAYLTAPNKRRNVISALRNVKLLEQPESPCVALFQAPNRVTHVGIWLDNRVLHIANRRQGVQYQPLEVVRFGFSRVRFFTCK